MITTHNNQPLRYLCENEQSSPLIVLDNSRLKIDNVNMVVCEKTALGWRNVVYLKQTENIWFHECRAGGGNYIMTWKREHFSWEITVAHKSQCLKTLYTIKHSVKVSGGSRDKTVWKFHITIIVTKIITVISIMTVLLICAENVISPSFILLMY